MEDRDTGSGQIERRRFLQQTATVAFAAPVIVSMMSGAAQARPQCGTKVEGGQSTACHTTSACTTGFECLGEPGAFIDSPCFCEQV